MSAFMHWLVSVKREAVCQGEQQYIYITGNTASEHERDLYRAGENIQEYNKMPCNF